MALKCLLRPGDAKSSARFTREIHALGRVLEVINGRDEEKLRAGELARLRGGLGIDVARLP